MLILTLGIVLFLILVVVAMISSYVPTELNPDPFTSEEAVTLLERLGITCKLTCWCKTYIIESY